MRFHNRDVSEIHSSPELCLQMHQGERDGRDFPALHPHTHSHEHTGGRPACSYLGSKVKNVVLICENTFLKVSSKQWKWKQSEPPHKIKLNSLIHKATVFSFIGINNNNMLNGFSIFLVFLGPSLQRLWEFNLAFKETYVRHGNHEKENWN